jgi:hypothetical protein
LAALNQRPSHGFFAMLNLVSSSPVDVIEENYRSWVGLRTIRYSSVLSSYAPEEHSLLWLSAAS